MYRSTYCWPRSCLEVSGQLHAPAFLPPEKLHPIPFQWEAGSASEPVLTTWRGEESYLYRVSNSNPSIVHPVASRVTDCCSGSHGHSNTYVHTYSLTEPSPLEDSPIVQPLKNFPAFYGTRTFNTVFTRALDWSLS
jgi:hypothetical protein